MDFQPPVWTCVSESLHSLKSQQDKKGESCPSSDNETILGEIDSTIRYFTIHKKCLHWLCFTCSVTCTYTDLVELLDRITFGWSHWWHGNLSLLSPYFMIKSQLYFLVRPNPHEAYIISSFFFLSNLALSFYIPSSFRWCLPGLLSFL